MSDKTKCTPEQYETMADMLECHAGLGHKTRYDAGKLLRQAAQMMREREGKEYVKILTSWEKSEREVGGAVTDEYLRRARSAYVERAVYENHPERDREPIMSCLDAALESFAARRAAVPDGFVKVGTARTDGAMHFAYLPWSVKDGDAVFAAAPDVTK